MAQIDDIVLTHHEKRKREKELRRLVGGIETPDETHQIDPDVLLADLIDGFESLESAVEAGDVVRFFLNLAQRQGGRLLLLRNWGEGLRVMLSHGVELPARLLDPKAVRPKVITLHDTDIFTVLAREQMVYDGPFPMKNFPQELARALQASEDRPVLLIPLPLRGRWGTFLYMDWLQFQGHDRIREAAALARYAVMRLHGLEHDVLPVGLETQRIKAGVVKAQREREMSGYADLQPGDLPPEAVYGQLGELTALPEVAGRIMTLIGNPSTTAVQLEKEIARDLVLTARMLRVANSSFYVGNSEIKTIRDAVVRLGFKTVRNWTLVTASRSVFPGVDTSPVLNRIWSRSVRTAVASQIVAEEQLLEDCEVAFVGGLMQNIGQLILARAQPGLFERIEQLAEERNEPMWCIEREMLGYDHGTLGALLIEDWNLSPRLGQAVRHHHELAADMDPESLGAVIALGEDLARSAQYQEPETWEEIFRSSEAARILNVDWEKYCIMTCQVASADLDGLD